MKTSLRLIKYLGAIVISFILMTIIPSQIVQHLNYSNPYIIQCVYLLAIIVILTATIVIFGEKKVFAFSLKSFKDTFVIGGVMTAITVFYFVTGIYKSINEYGTPLMDGKTIVLFLVGTFLGAGIREELLTRGVWLTFFRKAFGNSKASYIVAMSLSSIAFGALHISNLNGTIDPTPIYAQIIYAIGIGFFLAALYLRTGNLWGNMVLHYLFDISLMIKPMIYENRSDLGVLIGEWLGSGIILKSILISVVSVVIGLYLIRGDKFKEIAEAE
ncbi:CPBP family intramembrane glutamic endopeptidase [Pseudobutyrivibrio sp.]|uniref:CPBP family intramembrane glutamic endopeptidase n=1 Tax=Pseudobutyrivibrio sp. TaxID=2014367 RepID=UPI0025D5FD51|nr:type II CAAX endopeptidase family protein [Pseudobutyrivibrio sp.]MBR5649593.1 CPBP family intramembrane metalloprotease [Pseudobutyrivibrio sp.]